jgi:hypothetical protein
MAESDEQRDTKAAGLARDQERAAISLAEQRGREAAQLEGRLDEHDKHFAVVNGSIERTAKGLERLEGVVADLAGAFKENAAVTAARAADAKEAAERQVSTRTFVLGLLGAVAAIGALLAGTGHT